MSNSQDLAYKYKYSMDFSVDRPLDTEKFKDLIFDALILYSSKTTHKMAMENSKLKFDFSKEDNNKEVTNSMKHLSETIQLMTSDDYKERFKAEYWQTKIRYQKLHDMVVKYEAGTLSFQPRCPIELLKQQKSSMGTYLYHLEVRAEIEGIDLER